MTATEHAERNPAIEQLIARWDSPDGHPYKGQLIDWKAYESDPDNIGCMCAQGQALHLVGGMSHKDIYGMNQVKADAETAKLLGISRAHAILLRLVNDSVDGAPALVLTHPEKVLGDQAHIVLAFWRYLDRITKKQWDAARDAARDAAKDTAGAAGAAARIAAGVAAGDAAGDTAWDATRAAAKDAIWAAGAAARAAARDAAGAAASYACAEIQGAALMRKNGKAFYFLPMFGFADPEAVLAADLELTK